MTTLLKTIIPLSIFSFTCTSTIAAAQPNIIVFLVDDMGWQDTSVPFAQTPEGRDFTSALNKRYKTPGMERLAEKGVRFTRAYACPVSSPSRVSLMTGANAARHGVTTWTHNRASNTSTDNIKRLGVFAPSDWNLNGMAPAAGTPQQKDAGTLTARTFPATPLAQILRESGYRTIHVGKAHFGTKATAAANPLNLGFDVNIAGRDIGGPTTYIATALQENGGYLYGPDGGGNTVYGLTNWNKDACNLTEALTRASFAEIDIAKSKNQPFFLYLSHYAVHSPYGAKTSLDTRFTTKDKTSPDYVYSFYNPKSPYYTPGYDKLSGQQKVYTTMISSMDKSLSDVLDKVEKDPELAKNTIILFMSDNGGYPGNGNAPAREGKGSCWEGGIHEPMIVFTPEMAAGKADSKLAGTKNATPVIIEDFFPTILDWAGVKNPKTVQTIDGKSFVQALKSPKAKLPERALVFHYPNGWDGFINSAIIGDPTSAIVKGDFKYIYLYKTQEHFLYNLKNDIGEKNNLAKKNPAKVNELKKELSKLLRERKAPMLYQTKEKKAYVPYPDGDC